MSIRVNKAISKFEKINGIRICDYHSSYDIRTMRGNVDNYIGEDIFKGSIEDWLEICETKKDKEYFLTLLENYIYYSEDKFKKSIRRIIQELQDKEIDMCETVFVVFPSRKGVASGGDNISSTLKVLLMPYGLKEGIVTDYVKAVRHNKDIFGSVKNIVFIDDVVGSGFTMYGNVKQTVTRFIELNYITKETRLFIAAICADEKKLLEKVDNLKTECLSKIGCSVEAVFISSMEKSLSDRHLLDSYGKERIYYYEELINAEDVTPDKKNCVGGFEQCEFLLSFYYNTPNNTLSIFWLPTDSNNPIFTRTSYKRKRPIVNDCKKSKYLNRLRAYFGGYNK